jgi:hypothetical protein
MYKTLQVFAAVTRLAECVMHCSRLKQKIILFDLREHATNSIYKKLQFVFALKLLIRKKHRYLSGTNLIKRKQLKSNNNYVKC